METTGELNDGGAPAVVGIAAMIGFAKAAFEGLFGVGTKSARAYFA